MVNVLDIKRLMKNHDLELSGLFSYCLNVSKHSQILQALLLIF